jgi:OOP family OmpA-OmpF porin
MRASELESTGTSFKEEFMVRSISSLGARTLAVAALAMLVPMGASASGHDWELGPLVGIHYPDDELTGHGPDADHSALTAGLRVGFDWQDHFEPFADVMFASFGTAKDAGDVTRIALRGGLEVMYPSAAEDFQFFLAPAIGYLNTGWKDADSNKNSFISFGIGSRWTVRPHHQLRWEFRAEDTILRVAELDRDIQNAEFLVGYSYLFGGNEADSDGDGVADSRDDCPNTAPGVKVDAHGCPKDSDGDGVPDSSDKCPKTPKGAAVDRDGCPTADADGDGVPDRTDKCPDTPRGAKVDATGCPLDTDGDGVYDGIDQCPGTPAGTKVDAKGCPSEVKNLFEGEKKELVLEGVNFESNKAVITDYSKKILDRVATSLAAYPHVKVEVGGHTDSTGDDQYNMDLSAKRAQAVVDYLVAHGVSASQLTSKGYGETKPVVDNATKEGRAKNRRVELKKTN